MSVEIESLSSILGESPFTKGESAPAEPAPPAVEVKVDEPTETKPETTARDESGRFTRVEKPEDKPEAKLAEKPTPADIAAIIDERRKRQAAERELEQLRAGKAKPDFWESPEQAVVEKVNEFVNPLRSQMLELQVENARLRNPDFDDAMMAFLEASQKDEVLRYQADNSPNPLQFIYREGKRIKELAPYGGDLNKRDEARFADLNKEIGKRDELIKSMAAELEAVKKAQAELSAVPRSLNTLPSASAKASEADPEDINNIVRFKSG